MKYTKIRGKLEPIAGYLEQKPAKIPKPKTFKNRFLKRKQAKHGYYDHLTADFKKMFR